MQKYVKLINIVSRNCSELIERFVSDIKITLAKENIDDQTATILPNCADLFLFYKKSLVQCTELSNHNPMLSLAAVFQKYLREYATKILEVNLPKYKKFVFLKTSIYLILL